MKLSVALTTYNGEKYLAEQLQSIITQALPVQEIVVCDDGSTDNTQQILEEYQAKYPKIFSIYKNKNALGVIKNFEKAINHCSGDLIFLCDQDDIWFKNKTETIVSFFEKQPNTDAVFHDLVLYANGESLEKNVWENLKFTEEVKNLTNTNLIIHSLLVTNVLTGAACTIRNRKIKFSNSNQILHDAQILIEYALCNKLQYLDQTLGYYRIHENQQVGVNISTNAFLEYKYNTFYHAKNLHDVNQLYKKSLATLKDIKDKTPSLMTAELHLKNWYSEQVKIHIQNFGLIKKWALKLKWMYK